MLLLAIVLADLQGPSLGMKIYDLLQSRRMNPGHVKSSALCYNIKTSPGLEITYYIKILTGDSRWKI